MTSGDADRTSPYVNLLMCLLGLHVACGGSGSTPSGSSPTAPSLPSPAPTLVCRTYATQFTSTGSVSPGPPINAVATYVASFNTADATYSQTIRISADGCSTTTVSRGIYANVADFVDEGQLLGKALAVRGESTLTQSGTCLGPLTVTGVTSFTYDNQRRRTGFTSQSSTGTLLTESYSSWDAQGRPLVGTQTFPGCARPLAIRYDDVNRTITQVLSPGPGGCGGMVDATIVQMYDRDFNLVQATVTGGGITSTTTVTINDTTRVCR